MNTNTQMTACDFNNLVLKHFPERENYGAVEHFGLSITEIEMTSCEFNRLVVDYYFEGDKDMYDVIAHLEVPYGEVVTMDVQANRLTATCGVVRWINARRLNRDSRYGTLDMRDIAGALIQLGMFPAGRLILTIKDGPKF